MASQRTEPDVVTTEEVLKRAPMLSRISRDVINCYEHRHKLKERLEEFVVISRKFNSPEIQETIESLRRKVAEDDTEMDVLEKEVGLLGGVLKEQRQGFIYFYTELNDHRVYLVWDPADCDMVYWHELDETYEDRTPLQFSDGPTPSAIDTTE
jgi:hypothetical protein